MDYEAVTSDLMRKLAVLFRSHSHKQMGEFMGGEMFILNYLTFVHRPVLPSELSSAMKTSTARIAAILNSLERKNWITREMDESDRRKILVTITESGKNFVFEKRRHVHKNIEMILRELGEKDVNEGMRILDRVIEIFKNKTNFCDLHSHDLQ